MATLKNTPSTNPLAYFLDIYEKIEEIKTQQVNAAEARVAPFMKSVCSKVEEIVLGEFQNSADTHSAEVYLAMTPSKTTYLLAYKPLDWLEMDKLDSKLEISIFERELFNAGFRRSKFCPAKKHLPPHTVAYKIEFQF